MNPDAFANDVLNPFNEAAMLLDMAAVDAECLADFLAWRPVTYREHFVRSGLRDAPQALAAYEAASPGKRAALDAALAAIAQAVQAAQARFAAGPIDPEEAGAATQALFALIAAADAVIAQPVA